MAAICVDSQRLDAAMTTLIPRKLQNVGAKVDEENVTREDLKE